MLFCAIYVDQSCVVLKHRLIWYFGDVDDGFYELQFSLLDGYPAVMIDPVERKNGN